MANTDLSKKYYFKRDINSALLDVTSLFDGVKILKISGFNDIGEAVNIYSEQWIDEQSQKEDFMITSQDQDGNDVIIRKNVKLQMTFIVGNRYSSSDNFDTQSAHDAFIDYVCNHGDFYVFSKYTGKTAHVVCKGSYTPTTEKLHRKNSWIMGTIELDMLEKPTARAIE